MFNLRPLTSSLLGVAATIVLIVTPIATAWDSAGHRAITWLALDGLSSDLPAFLRDPKFRNQIAWHAAEPDRWRAQKSQHLIHINNPDHFLDIEELDMFGLTLESMPPLRHQYVAAMAVARHTHPETAKPHNPKLDPAGQQEWPGFLAHAIAENHGKLAAMFKTYRMLDAMNDPARADQLEMMRNAIMHQIGVLSHYTGDAAQPLHTTKHFNGWVGDNPKGYTTEKTFHAYIDGGVLTRHALNYASLKTSQTYDRTADPTNPWKDILAHIQRSHDKFRDLYELKKSGDLDREPGKALITERLNDGAAMLTALINSAWKAGEPTDKDKADFAKFDAWTPAEQPK